MVDQIICHQLISLIEQKNIYSKPNYLELFFFLIGWIWGWDFQTEIPEVILHPPLNRCQFYWYFGLSFIRWHQTQFMSLIGLTSLHICFSVVKGISSTCSLMSEIKYVVLQWLLGLYFLSLLNKGGLGFVGFFGFVLVLVCCCFFFFFLTMCLFWIFISLQDLVNILFNENIYLCSTLLFLDSFSCWIDLTYSLAK